MKQLQEYAQTFEQTKPLIKILLHMLLVVHETKIHNHLLLFIYTFKRTCDLHQDDLWRFDAKFVEIQSRVQSHE